MAEKAKEHRHELGREPAPSPVAPLDRPREAADDDRAWAGRLATAQFAEGVGAASRLTSRDYPPDGSAMAPPVLAPPADAGTTVKPGDADQQRELFDTVYAEVYERLDADPDSDLSKMIEAKLHKAAGFNLSRDAEKVEYERKVTAARHAARAAAGKKATPEAVDAAMQAEEEKVEVPGKDLDTALVDIEATRLAGIARKRVKAFAGIEKAVVALDVEEKKLLAGRKEPADAHLGEATMLIRGEHRERFEAKLLGELPMLRMRAAELAWEEARFGAARLFGMDTKGATKAGDAGELMKIPDRLRADRHKIAGMTQKEAIEKNLDWRPIDARVLHFLDELKKEGATFNVGTYGKGEETKVGTDHGPFAVDVYLPRKAPGHEFYYHDAAVAFFLKVDDVARRLGCEWFAVYNDFDVAKDVAMGLPKTDPDAKDDEGPGKGHIRFGFKHGPDPMKLHIHLDIRPGKDSPLASRPGAQ